MSMITQSIDLAVSRLSSKDIVAIPTETVYGLAGSALEEEAIKKIYALKKRPLNHPLILHIAKDWDLSTWACDIPDYAKILIRKFWPGPLTLVLHCKPGSVSPLITGGQNTIAIRCPKHPIAQSLLNALGFPLVAPSANPFGKISPTTALHVEQSFKDEPLLILDGGRCSVGIESTIVAATNPLGYQILRHGMLDEEAIQQSLAVKSLADKSPIRVPGKLASHYQPEKPLFCFEDRQKLIQFCLDKPDVYILTFNITAVFAHYQAYELPQNPDAFAYELYYQLRLADLSSASLIAMELPPNEAQWEGIRERLLKAASLPN